MKVYVENLYHNIIEKNSDNFSRLRIISGYASSFFLSRILNDFPDLNIELFIGMSIFGVSKHDHLEFQNIVRKNEKVNVYYQVRGTPNHMKILEFSSSADKKVYIGSANFSENGFYNHKELMIEINLSLDALFEEQRADSLLCTDDNIEKLIPLYEHEILNSSKKELLDIVQLERNDISYSAKNAVSLNKRRDELRSRIDPDFYKEFELTIVLPNKYAGWNRKGINSWVKGKIPVLEQTPRLLFNKVFPRNHEFIIYTDDNKVLKAKLSGQFESQLMILNLNLYEYIRGRIGLKEKRPISYDDLKLRGFTKMYFTRINETEYAASFTKETL